jgi:hypothetical protein
MNDTDEVFRFSSSCEGEKILFQMSRPILPELLKNFKNFLNASGFDYVKVIEAKDGTGNCFTSDEDGMYEGTLGDCVQAIAEVDSDESDDLPF